MIDLSNTSCFILSKELHVSQAFEESLLMNFLYYYVQNVMGRCGCLRDRKLNTVMILSIKNLLHKEYNILSNVKSRFIVKV